MATTPSPLSMAAFFRREAARLSLTLLKTLAFVYLPVLAAVTLLHYPYDTDPADTAAGGSARRSFYEAAYTGTPVGSRGADYEEGARRNAEADGIVEKVQRFARAYALEDKRVLEVGSGHGLLQDVVADYTGLDLSSKVARLYHKPFVAGSATAMPFPDQSFDSVWTFWVLEHIPAPERALREMRRVMKDGGILMLSPAWECTPWAADGFNVRPYSDFNLWGKLVKASLPVVESPYYRALHAVPVRAVRQWQYSLGRTSTPLRFRALDPNYDVYWEADTDAAVSLTRHEAWLWFRARGDECLNCPQTGLLSFDSTGPLVIRIRKNGA